MTLHVYMCDSCGRNFSRELLQIIVHKGTNKEEEQRWCLDCVANVDQYDDPEEIPA